MTDNSLRLNQIHHVGHHVTVVGRDACDPGRQTFEGDGFVVCSFCPRPYDFDPQAALVLYNHSNVVSDEVLHGASAEFMHEP